MASFTNPVSPFGGIIVALLLLAPFLLWRWAKTLRAARRFEQNNIWIVAFVDFLLLPIAAYGAGGFVSELMGFLDLPKAEGVAVKATELLIYLAIASGCARLIEVWLITQNADGVDTKLSQLSRSALFGVSLFVALIVFFRANDYEPTELYVSTGAFAALLAFAMQQTLGDLFSGISLSIEKPFKIGDWLRFSDGSEGQVTDINWRATRLRGWDNTTFVMPNGQLARQSFTNLHGPNHLYAPWYFIRISGEADPTQITKILETAARQCGTVLSDPAPVARLTDGEKVPYTYMVWVHFRNYPSMFAGREELYTEIRAALLNAGLQLASDIQEVRFRPLEKSATE